MVLTSKWQLGSLAPRSHVLMTPRDAKNQSSKKPTNLDQPGIEVLQRPWLLVWLASLKPFDLGRHETSIGSSPWQLETLVLVPSMWLAPRLPWNQVPKLGPGAKS
jgi:hypothetical protein